MKLVQWVMQAQEVTMAEVHIAWSDGRTEIRSLLPGQITSIGDSRLPVLVEELPIGGNLRLGRKYKPFARIRLHGNEIPGVRLVTGKSTSLPSAIVRSRNLKRQAPK